jgi:hypothetical protein
VTSGRESQPVGAGIPNAKKSKSSVKAHHGGIPAVCLTKNVRPTKHTAKLFGKDLETGATLAIEPTSIAIAVETSIRFVEKENKIIIAGVKHPKDETRNVFLHPAGGGPLVDKRKVATFKPVLKSAYSVLERIPVSPTMKQVDRFSYYQTKQHNRYPLRFSCHLNLPTYHKPFDRLHGCMRALVSDDKRSGHVWWLTDGATGNIKETCTDVTSIPPNSNEYYFASQKASMSFVTLNYCSWGEVYSIGSVLASDS